MTHFLSGVTVLQLGNGVAGAAASALLAGLGAHVSRVAQGESTARSGPILQTKSGSVAAVDLTLDHGKRIIPPPASLSTIVDDYDIVIADHDQTLAPPVAENAVVVCITPFGLDGPRSAQPGGELIAQAAGGMLATIEGTGGMPVPAPGYVALKAVGAVAALAALHGLDERQSTHTSVLVDVSVQEAVIFAAALPECAHVLYSCPGRAGSGRYLAPSGLFSCSDGLVRITAVENHQWRGLIAALGHPGWAEGLDERDARIEHSDLINQQVATWARTRDKEGCAALLQAHGVPSTPVNTPQEILTSPQFVSRRAVSAADLAGTVMSVLAPPWQVTTGAPTGRPRTGRLSDLRIVELTHVLAGPIIGALLGGMGAQVLRVEDPERLDIYRRTGPFAEGKPGVERGAYFAVSNHSKQSLLIESASATAEVAAVLMDSDVLIENVGGSRLKRLDVDPDAIAASGRLAVRVSGFGATGPMARYRVYANNVQSYGGLAGLTIGPDGSPARLGTVIADPLSSIVAAAVIAAWAVGPQHDTGAVIDLSMAEVVAFTVAEYVAAASAPDAVGDNPAPPHRGVYQASDGRFVAIELAEPQDWAGLAAITRDAPQLAELVTAAPAHDVAAQFTAAGLRAAVVQRAEDLVADPHLAARGFFPEIAHPDPAIGTARLVGLPWRFAGRGPVRLAPPPALGSANTRHERITSAT